MPVHRVPLVFALLAIAGFATAGERPNEALRGTLTAAEPAVPAGAGVALTFGLRTGFSSNADGFSGGRQSPYGEVAGEFAAVRRIGEIDLSLGLRGSSAEYLDAPGASQGLLEGEAGLARTFASGLRAALGLNFSFEDDRGARQSDLGATAEIGGTGSLAPYLALAANRVDHLPESLGPGITLTNEGRDHARLGAETGLALTSASGLAGTLALGGLVYDYGTRDLFAFDRGARAVFLRGSLSFARGSFAASLDARLLRRLNDDPFLEDVDVLILDADLSYALSDATGIAFALTSDLEETDLPFAAGSLTHYAELGVSHALGPRHALRGAVYLDREHFLGVGRTDRAIGVLAALERNLQDDLVLDLTAEYERFESPALDERFGTFKLSTGIRYVMAAQ